MHCKYHLCSILIFTLVHISVGSFSKNSLEESTDPTVIPNKLYEEFNCARVPCKSIYTGQIIVQHQRVECFKEGKKTDCLLEVGTKLSVLSKKGSYSLVQCKLGTFKVHKDFISKFGPASSQSNYRSIHIHPTPSRTDSHTIRDSSTSVQKSEPPLLHSTENESNEPGAEDIDNEDDFSNQVREEEERSTSTMYDGLKNSASHIDSSNTPKKTDNPDSKTNQPLVSSQTPIVNHSILPVFIDNNENSQPIKEETSTINNQSDNSENNKKRTDQETNGPITGASQEISKNTILDDELSISIEGDKTNLITEGSQANNSAGVDQSNNAKGGDEENYTRRGDKVNNTEGDGQANNTAEVDQANTGKIDLKANNSKEFDQANNSRGDDQTNNTAGADQASNAKGGVQAINVKEVNQANIETGTGDDQTNHIAGADQARNAKESIEASNAKEVNQANNETETRGDQANNKTGSGGNQTIKTRGGDQEYNETGSGGNQTKNTTGGDQEYNEIGSGGNQTKNTTGGDQEYNETGSGGNQTKNTSVGDQEYNETGSGGDKTKTTTGDDQANNETGSGGNQTKNTTGGDPANNKTGSGGDKTKNTKGGDQANNETGSGSNQTKNTTGDVQANNKTGSGGDKTKNTKGGDQANNETGLGGKKTKNTTGNVQANNETGPGGNETKTTTGGDQANSDKGSGGDKTKNTKGGDQANNETGSGGNQTKNTTGDVQANSEIGPGGNQTKTTTEGDQANSETESGGDKTKNTTGGHQANSKTGSGGDKTKNTKGGVQANNETGPGGDQTKTATGGDQANNETGLGGDQTKNTTGGDQANNTTGGYQANNETVSGGDHTKNTTRGVQAKNETGPGGNQAKNTTGGDQANNETGSGGDQTKNTTGGDQANNETGTEGDLSNNTTETGGDQTNNTITARDLVNNIKPTEILASIKKSDSTIDIEETDQNEKILTEPEMATSEIPAPFHPVQKPSGFNTLYFKHTEKQERHGINGPAVLFEVKKDVIIKNNEAESEQKGISSINSEEINRHWLSSQESVKSNSFREQKIAPSERSVLLKIWEDLKNGEVTYLSNYILGETFLEYPSLIILLNGVLFLVFLLMLNCLNTRKCNNGIKGKLYMCEKKLLQQRIEKVKIQELVNENNETILSYDKLKEENKLQNCQIDVLTRKIKELNEHEKSLSLTMNEYKSKFEALEEISNKKNIKKNYEKLMDQVKVQKDKLNELAAGMEERAEGLRKEKENIESLLKVQSEEHAKVVNDYRMLLNNIELENKELREIVQTVSVDSDVGDRLLESVKLQVRLSDLEKENVNLNHQLEGEREAHKLLEDHQRITQKEVNDLRESYELVLKEKSDICNKLKYITDYFQQLEDKLKKEIADKDDLLNEKLGDDDSLAKALLNLRKENCVLNEENNILREKYESLKVELTDQKNEEKLSKTKMESEREQIWMNWRAAERKIESLNLDNKVLRSKLVTMGSKSETSFRDMHTQTYDDPDKMLSPTSSLFLDHTSPVPQPAYFYAIPPPPLSDDEMRHLYNENGYHSDPDDDQQHSYDHRLPPLGGTFSPPTLDNIPVPNIPPPLDNDQLWRRQAWNSQDISSNEEEQHNSFSRRRTGDSVSSVSSSKRSFV